MATFFNVPYFPNNNCNHLFHTHFFPILGLNNKRNPRDWDYLSGGTSSAPLLSYTNWGKNQPQTRGRRDRRNCVLVNKRRKWKNKSCTKNLKRFICEGVPGQKFSSLQSSPSDQPNRNRGKRRRRYRWSS
uniref:C-type lectin domain-containing protein n=1 Tax=Magallana gigas TaxID=29159 RepID=A0A8W8M354_MAGGI